MPMAAFSPNHEAVEAITNGHHIVGNEHVGHACKVKQPLSKWRTACPHFVAKQERLTWVQGAVHSELARVGVDQRCLCANADG